MATELFPLKLRPGMARNGTEYDNRGRWIDGNLVRWQDKTLQPVGGWGPIRVLLPTEQDLVVGGIPRTALA